MEKQVPAIINHKGKKIISIDYTNIGNDKEKVIDLLRNTTVEYQKNPPGTVLALTNATNLHFDMDVLRVFNEEGDKTAAYEKKVAVIGVKGLLKVAYNFVVTMAKKGRFQVFDTQEEALEWLAKD